MIWKVFQALFVAAATLRNLGEGDLPHQMRPASQKVWHPAPSCVPQLQSWGGGRGWGGAKTFLSLPCCRDRIVCTAGNQEKNLWGWTCSPQSRVPNIVGQVCPAEGHGRLNTAGTAPYPEFLSTAPARAGIWLMGLRIKLSLQSKVLTGQKSAVMLRSAGWEEEGCAN